MRKILVLWPTVRYSMAMDTAKVWMEKQGNKNGVIYVFYPHLTDIGVCSALAEMIETLSLADTDIIMVGSDDVYPTAHWDFAVLKEFEGRYFGAVQFEDGIRKGRRIYTTFCMTASTLKAMNYFKGCRDYYHCYSDNEAYENLMERGFLKDATSSSDVKFEHRHYSNGLREADYADAIINAHLEQDKATFERRMKMTLEERLK